MHNMVLLFLSLPYSDIYEMTEFRRGFPCPQTARFSPAIVFVKPDLTKSVYINSFYLVIFVYVNKVSMF